MFSLCYHRGNASDVYTKLGLLLLFLSSGSLNAQKLIRDALYYAPDGAHLRKMEREYRGDHGDPQRQLLVQIEPGKDIRYRQERTYSLGDTSVTEWVHGRIRRTLTRTEQFLAADKQEYEPDVRSGFTKFSYFRGNTFIGDTVARIDPRDAGNYKAILVRSFIRKLRNGRLKIDMAPEYREVQALERFYEVNGRPVKAEWLDASAKPYYRVRFVWEEGTLLRIYEKQEDNNSVTERTDKLTWNSDSSEIHIQVNRGFQTSEDFTLELRRNRIRRRDAGDVKWMEETVYLGRPDLFYLLTTELPGKERYVQYDVQYEGRPLVKRRFFVEGAVYIESYKFHHFSGTLHTHVIRKNGFAQAESRYYYYK